MSSVPGLLTTIIDYLAGHDALSGVLVRWGIPPALPKERERLYVLGVQNFTRAPVSGGHRVRTEDYSVRGLAEVHMLGSAGPDQAATRLWDILDAVDDVLHAAHDFEYARYSGDFAVGNDDVIPATDGWICRAMFTLGMDRFR